jgi:hypothetical protein
VRFFSATFLRLLETYGFLYRNRKNVIYSRNVMRNFLPPLRVTKITGRSEGRNKKPEKFGTAASVPPLRKVKVIDKRKIIVVC